MILLSERSKLTNEGCRQIMKKLPNLTFEHMSKLEKAKQIVNQTAEANIAVERDVPQASRPSP